MRRRGALWSVVGSALALLALLAWSTTSPAQVPTQSGCSSGTSVVCYSWTTSYCSRWSEKSIVIGTEVKTGGRVCMHEVTMTQLFHWEKVANVPEGPGSAGANGTGGGGSGEGGFGKGDPFDCGDPDLWSDDSQQCSDFQEMS